jgi:hypothetical protein
MIYLGEFLVPVKQFHGVDLHEWHTVMTVIKRFRKLGGRLEAVELRCSKSGFIVKVAGSSDVDAIARLTNRLYTMYRAGKLKHEWEIQHPKTHGTLEVWEYE